MEGIKVLPADTGGCGWYRLRYPCQVLGIEPMQTWPKAAYANLPGHPMKAVDLDADVFVMQRPLQRESVEAIPVLQKQGTAVVVEIDDDFQHLPTGHPARRDTSPAQNTEMNRRWLKKACDQADLVTVSTPALAEVYAPHGRYAVLPNLIPKRYLSIRAEPHDGKRVGWTGSVVTHVGDLEVTGGALNRLDCDLYVVGTGKGVADRLGWTGEVHATGWTEMAEYPHAYAGMDAAVVPLALNRFNEAKSWLKGIEAAALGVPFVASPTGEYLRLHGLGAGLVAGTPGEWYDHLRLVLTEVSYWEEMRDVGRSVAAGLTYEEHAWRWLEAWQEAIRHHRHRYRGAAA